MRRMLALGLGGAVLTAVVVVQGQDPAVKPDKYSPLGYYDLEAHIRAFPGTPGSLEVRRASTARFWAFQGLAYRNGPDPLGAVWVSEGPESVLQSPTALPAQSVSGRVAALAISPHCRKQGPCRLWVATAGRGVWRTDDAMNTEDPGWQWISRGLRTNSIGSITVDPNDRSANTVYVGTGETNTPQNSNAGTGLYKSIDGGDTWTRVTTTTVDPVVSPAPIDFTITRGISTIVIEPGRPQTMYVATTTAMLGMTAVRGGQSQSTGYVQPRPGLYKTDNGGVTWSLIWVPPLAPGLEPTELNAGGSDTMSGVRHVKLDPRNNAIVYATAWNNAIHRSAPSLESGDAAFKPVFAVVGLQRHRDLAMFDLTVKDGRTRIYVYNGTEATSTQGLYRLDNADVPAASLVTGTGANVVNTSAWVSLSSNNTSQVGSISRALCSAQCFYDLVVAVPDGQPDTVILGGVAAPTYGEATIRSIDAGVRFHGFGRDGQNPRASSHVDVRAVVFHPEDPDIAFVGSDGGVVRNDGSFVDISSRCSQLFGTAPQCGVVLARVPNRIHFMNRGLQTMQFYNIAIDPQDPLRRMIGGLQDNGTIWRDGSGEARTWKPLFAFGDGTSASGFHPSRASVLFASLQSNRYFVNFRNADQSMWVRVDDPIRAADERASITTSTGRQFITFDLVNPDTQFTGFQHIWRTQNNGGPQAFLEANCRFPTGAVSGVSCGDWQPLGVTYPFASQTNPASTSRKPGDLTSDLYGGNREGGIIVAAERSVADAGTLWAATSRGRLFVSRNADAAASSVAFSRIDTPETPGRFITKIAADPNNVNAAFVSYSGFNALTPATPGHVFRVVYNPATDQATFTSLDHDLGDLPINTMAYDHLRGDVYAATDFGPLVLRNGSNTWAIAGVGFPEVVMVDLKIVPERGLLVAATHGLGIFSLKIN